MNIVELSAITYEEFRNVHKCETFGEGKTYDHGSAVIMCEGTDLYATVWLGVNNVALMVNKEEIKSFKFLIK